MTPYVLTLLSAVAILITSVTLGLWQILSAPDRPNYPTSGKVKRFFMFAGFALFMMRGSEMLTTLHGPNPIMSTPTQAGASFVICGLFVTFLVDHCRNWLPARTHRNIQRLYRIARCSPRKSIQGARASAILSAAASTLENAPSVDTAVRDLALSGVRVSRPNEGPEAFTKTPR